MNIPTQAYILGLFLTCWILIIGYQALSVPETQHVPLINRSGPKAQSSSTDIQEMSLDLRALLSQTSRSTDISKKGLKNIFTPLSFPQTQKRVLARNPKQDTPHNNVPIKHVQVSPEDLVAKRARDAMAEYRFLGLVYEGVQAKVFLVHDQEIFIVGEGDVLKDNIRLVKVEPTSILLRYAETDITATISISDSQAL